MTAEQRGTGSASPQTGVEMGSAGRAGHHARRPFGCSCCRGAAAAASDGEEGASGVGEGASGGGRTRVGCGANSHCRDAPAGCVMRAWRDYDSGGAETDGVGIWTVDDAASGDDAAGSCFARAHVASDGDGGVRVSGLMDADVANRWCCGGLLPRA